MRNSKGKSAEDAIRDVLLHDWNPLRLQDSSITHQAYEIYVAPIRQMLIDKRTQKDLADYLEQAKISFGVPGFPRTRERKAARKLLEIVIGGDERNAA